MSTLDGYTGISVPFLFKRTDVILSLSISFLLSFLKGTVSEQINNNNNKIEEKVNME